jgi:hypothetical protein
MWPFVNRRYAGSDGSCHSRFGLFGAIVPHKQNNGTN